MGDNAEQGRNPQQATRDDDAPADAPVDAIALQGRTAFEEKRWDAAIAAFERVLAANPSAKEIKERLVAALQVRCQEFFGVDRSAGAIPYLRRLADFLPHDPAVRNYLIDILAINNLPAVLGDFTKAVRPEELGTHLFVACMPKSGSTFLANCLARLSGFPKTIHSFSFMQNEEELYLPSLVQFATHNKVTQQHCRATAANLQLMQAFAIRPIVLVRRLDDVVLSLLDFYDCGAVETTFLAGDYLRLSRDERIDAIIDFRLPWYVEFYVSWDQAERCKALPTLRLVYRDFIADKTETLARIGGFYGLNWKTPDILEAVAAVEDNRAANRFNKGVAGRGAAELTPAQKDRIRRLFRPFPTVDFSLIAV